MESLKRHVIRPLRSEDAGQVAKLHAKGIPTGVLADLGPSFLERLYCCLGADDGSFVIVGVDPSSKEVLGFVAGVEQVGGMFRRVLKSNWLALATASIGSMFSIRILGRVFSTIRYPSQTEGEFPEPELLSIVVAKQAWGSGLASELLEELEMEFRNRKISQFKVMVRADFERANAFYCKHGFTLAGKIDRHNHSSHIYTKAT